MKEINKESIRYKRYLVKAVDSITFDGEFDKGIIFTTDNRNKLVAYLREMPSEYIMDDISVFDCDERMFITEEFAIGFVKRKPVYAKEQEEMNKVWQLTIEKYFGDKIVITNNFNKENND